MKIVFVINNKNNRLSKLIRKLDGYCTQTHPGKALLLSTLRKKHAIELAKDATEKGCDFLIAVGGDGTLHEVVNGVLKSNIPANDYPSIGLLPYGSANDFARTARITNSIEELFQLINLNHTKRIDLGKIIVHATGETRYFINIAGVGLGPEVVQNLERSTSPLGSGINYFIQILKGFYAYVRKEIICTSKEWQWRGKLLQMAIGNGRYFGNAICITPDAILTDGQFQVAIFGDLSIWDYLKNLGNLKKGAKIRHPQVAYLNATETLLESSDACGIEADGEYVGLAPATISVLPRVISFLMPEDAE